RAQADQPTLIAGVADSNHDERGLGHAQPLRHLPQSRRSGKLIGDEDRAAAMRCELVGFVESAGRGDGVRGAGGVVNRVSERGVVGQNCDRNPLGGVDLGEVALRCVDLLCVALLCVALLCVALLCVALRRIGLRLLRAPAYSRDCEFAGALDVVQVANAHYPTVLALRLREYWTE